MAAASSEKVKEIYRICKNYLAEKMRDDYLVGFLGLIFLHYCEATLKIVDLAPVYEARDDKSMLDLLDSFARAIEINQNFRIRSIFPISYSKMVDDVSFVRMLKQVIKVFVSLDREEILPAIELLEYAINISNIRESREKEPCTPDCVAKLLAELLGARDEHPKTVYDPCSGYGTMLQYAAQKLNCSIAGQEISEITRAISIINLTIRGIDAHKIWFGDVFSHPHNVIGSKLDRFETFDAVIVNPPFWGKDWNANMVSPELNHHMTCEMDPWHRFDYGVPSPAKSEYAFLMHSSACTKKGGIVMVVAPYGALFRTSAEAKIRKIMLESGHLLGVIGLPARLYDSTPAPVCLIIFRKGETLNDIIADQQSEPLNDVFFIDASQLGEVSPSKRTRRVLSDKNIEKIVNTFLERKDIPLFARNVSLQEIRKNDYNLNISRYLSNRDDADLFNPDYLEKEITSLETRLVEVHAEMDRLLTDIRKLED